ncbi:MAG: hypothetical protein WD767_03925 [Alphaproteobacteria bacterium]
MAERTLECFGGNVMCLLRRMTVYGLLGAGIAAAPASAETCLEQAHEIADIYGLSIDPPDIGRENVPGTEAPDEAPPQGGVFEPAPTGDQGVMEPPDDRRYGMPTTPDVNGGAKPAENQDLAGLNPSDRILLESILIAARAEAKRGNEIDCYNQLEKAGKVIQRQVR